MDYFWKFNVLGIKLVAKYVTLILQIIIKCKLAAIVERCIPVYLITARK